MENLKYERREKIMSSKAFILTPEVELKEDWQDKIADCLDVIQDSYDEVICQMDSLQDPQKHYFEIMKELALNEANDLYVIAFDNGGVTLEVGELIKGWKEVRKKSNLNLNVFHWDWHAEKTGNRILDHSWSLADVEKVPRLKNKLHPCEYFEMKAKSALPFDVFTVVYDKDHPTTTFSILKNGKPWGSCVSEYESHHKRHTYYRRYPLFKLSTPFNCFYRRSFSTETEMNRAILDSICSDLVKLIPSIRINVDSTVSPSGSVHGWKGFGFTEFDKILLSLVCNPFEEFQLHNTDVSFNIEDLVYIKSDSSGTTIQTKWGGFFIHEHTMKKEQIVRYCKRIEQMRVEYTQYLHQES